MPRTLSDTGERMLDALPSYYSEAVDVRGVLDTAATEIEALDTVINDFLGDEGGDGELFPKTSVSLLAEWEKVFDLPVDPNKTDEQRRQAIESVLTSIKSSDSAASWKGTFDTLIGTGWSYVVDYDTYTITMYLPYGPEMSGPTGFSATATGTDGALPAGTYYYSVTAANAYGESPYEGGDAVVVAAGEHVELSWTAPSIGSPDRYYVYRGETLNTMQRLDTPMITDTTFIDGDGTAFPLLLGRSGFQAGPTLAPTESSTQSDAAKTALRIARAVSPAHINIASGYLEGFILNVSKVGDPL